VRKPRRWRRRLLLFVAGLLVLVWLAPIIVAHTSLLDRIIRMALADFDGSIHVGRASLDWFSAPVLEDIDVRDADGKPILSVSRIAGNRSLAALAWDSGELGVFRVEKPALSVVFSGTMTNLERSLALYLEGKGEQAHDSGGLPGLVVEVIAGQAALHDNDSGADWTVGPIEATVTVPGSAASPIQIHLAGAVNDSTRHGEIKADATIPLAAGLAVDGKIDVDGFPLAAAVPAMRRFHPGLRLGGSLDAHVQGSWAGVGGKVTGRVATHDVLLAAPELGDDRLSLRALDLSGESRLDGTHLVVQRLEASCDVGKATATGIDADFQDLLSIVNQPGSHVEVDADLARLAVMLPGVLHLQRDVRIASGRLHLNASSTGRTDGIAWEGSLRASDLRATRGKDTIAAPAPVAVEFRIRQAPHALPLIEHWHCDTGFLQVELGGTPEQLTATLSCDLDKLTAQLAGVIDLGSLRLAGKCTGQVTVRHPEAPDIGADLAVRDLLVGNPASPLWRDSEVRLSGRVRLDTAADSLQIIQVRVDSTLLQGTASGKIEKLSATQDVALAGELRCDVQKLEPYVRPYLGQGAKLEGHEARPFRLQGSLSPAAPAPLLVVLSGEAGLAWKSAQAFGCQVGAGEVKAALAGGSLRLGSIETSLNDGHVRLLPAVRLEPAPMELTLAKSSGVERFRLTPAACAGALGYALPALANVLEAEGQMSLVLDSARVPLTDPTATALEGRFIIHTGRVAPGPLIRELGAVLRVPSGANLTRESVVPVRMASGRIYHSNLELVFPELTIRTSGSVGVDGSLDLVAEMPVPPKWLGNSKAAKALANRTIRLLIRGTTASPKIDEHALRSTMTQIAREVGEDAVKQGLEKHLQDIFKRHK
jgi:hypothetical protein